MLITRPTNEERILLREAGLLESLRAGFGVIGEGYIAEAIEQRAHGLDLSRYDQFFNPAEDPPKPIDFVFQRTGYSTIKDNKFDVINPGVQLVDLRMAYHYFSTASDWKAQADKCLEISEGKNFHAWWMDYETAFNLLGRTSYENGRRWCEYMDTHTNGAIVGIYTNKNIYETLMNPFGDWHHEREFWYALYYYYPKPFIQTPPMPAKRTKSFDFWQYGITQAYGNTDDGLDYGVARSTVDVDVAMMTPAELYLKYRKDIVVPPPVVPSDKEKLDRLWDHHPEIH